MSSVSVIRSQIERRIPGALSSYAPPKVEMLATGIAAVDLKTGGIPKSGLTQICAPSDVSSGKTTLLFAAMAAVTAQEQLCALVDASDAFDPVSAEAAGVDLSRVLWIRCEQGTGVRPLEQAFRAADIIVQNGGFGLIAVDLGNIDERLVRKVPLSTWFRFARVVEKMPTALVFLLSCPAAQSCAALTLQLSGSEAHWRGFEDIPHAGFLAGFACEIEIGRTRTRKPVQSAPGKFKAKSLWA